MKSGNNTTLRQRVIPPSMPSLERRRERGGREGDHNGPGTVIMLSIQGLYACRSMYVYVCVVNISVKVMQ